MSSSVRSQPCGHGVPPVVLSRFFAGVGCRLPTSRGSCLEYVESSWKAIDPLPWTFRDDAGQTGVSAFQAATGRFNIRATSGLQKLKNLEAGLSARPLLLQKVCGNGQAGDEIGRGSSRDWRKRGRNTAGRRHGPHHPPLPWTALSGMKGQSPNSNPTLTT